MTLTHTWCFCAYHCFLYPLFPRGFTFPHRFAMNSSHSYCRWESLLCPHTWAVLAEWVQSCTFWNYSQVLLGFDFCLIITHSWFVLCDWLSHAGPWLSSGLSWWWRSLSHVAWIGLSFNSLSYPFSYFFSSASSCCYFCYPLLPFLFLLLSFFLSSYITLIFVATSFW